MDKTEDCSLLIVFMFSWLEWQISPPSSGRWSASRWIRIQTEKVVSANSFHMPKNGCLKSHLCILTELSSDNNCSNRWQRFFELIRGLSSRGKNVIIEIYRYHLLDHQRLIKKTWKKLQNSKSRLLQIAGSGEKSLKEIKVSQWKIILSC